MPITTLKDQYPLSPRKFWKKMIDKSIFVGILSVLFGCVALVIPSALNQYEAPDATSMFTFFALGFLVFFIVIMLPYALYVKAYIRRYYYDATDSYITIKKGVFAPAEIHVQYSKIQDVYVDQDIIDRIMGLYDVHLASATAASGIEAHIDGVEKLAADGLKNFLLQKLQNGGSGPSSPAFTPSAAPMMPNQSVSFDKEISSRTYPIKGRWLAQQMIAWFFTSIFYSALIDFWLISPGKNGDSSLMEMFGLGSGTLWGTFIISFVLIYACHLIYTLLWRSTYSFSFLPDYIVTKQGIIAKSENHLPYRSVQDVTVSQSIIERIFGIASVRIENAAAAQVVGKSVVSSAVRIPGQPLVQANEISDAIKRVALTKNSSQTGL